MSDYINKADLYNEIARLEEMARDTYLDTPWDSPAHIRYQTQLYERTDLKHLIADFPVADVAEVRHGEWVGLEYDGYANGNPVYNLWECSECGEEVKCKDNYCPNCGARMDKGDEHEAD